MGVSAPGLFFNFLLIGFLLTGCRAKNPELTISPSPPVQTKAVGRSALLTCQPDVDNKGLITDLVWKDPQNRTIDANYIDRQWATTEMMEEKALALIINSFQESQAGDYTCSATYASNIKLSKTVRLESIHPIKFEDAPEIQNPIIKQDYKIKCKVSANPAPHVDWSKNNDLIKASGRYVIEPDGLLISKVTESDDGVYICRAVVIKTGELASRSIKVEVHTPPVFHPMNSTVELVEGETASVSCSAYGKPKPSYSWIRKDNSANVAKMPRFSVNEATGLMIIDTVQENDHGEYKCVASNAAANVERIIKLSVNIKPKIYDIKNVSVAINRDIKLECVARGRPAPKITFRKFGTSERFTAGRQLYDDRIFLENRPGANENEVLGSLIIQRVKRTDDGLYECMASNSAADSFKTGHITVEFPPSFANTPMTEAYSWDARPVNLTCLAESIPNATINWLRNDFEVERDQFVNKFGSGPVSTLLVRPVDRKYYATYKCVAFNIHGSVNHTILLREAFRPSQPIQTDIESSTATTIKFKVIGPQFDGGIQVKSYIVQYKEVRQNWLDALNKTWTYGSPYVVENLMPQMMYNFRFAAINEVGMGQWSSEMTHVMPRISPPAAPEILNSRTEGLDYIQSNFDTKIEVKWKIPADNGEKIYAYQINYCEVVRKQYTTDYVGNCPLPIELDVQRSRKTSYVISPLKPDTFYKVEVAARNRLGISRPGEALFRTARGIDKDHLVATSNGLVLTSGAIVGIVVASLIVILLIIDVSCFFVNRAGVFYLMCGSKKKIPTDEINKLTSEEKEPLKENGRQKIEVMDDRLKKDTRIMYDDKNSTVKTFIGKDSAV